MMNIRYQFLILCPLLLTGCASMQATNEPVIPHDPVTVQTIVNQDGKSRFFVNGVGDVRAGSQYIAASGRVCRKLSTLEGVSLSLRSCQSETGQWYTTRSLSDTGSARTAPLASDLNL